MIIQPNYIIVTQKERYLMKDYISSRLRELLSKVINMIKIALRILSAGKLALNKLVSI